MSALNNIDKVEKVGSSVALPEDKTRSPNALAKVVGKKKVSKEDTVKGIAGIKVDELKVSLGKITPKTLKDIISSPELQDLPEVERASFFAAIISNINKKGILLKIKSKDKIELFSPKKSTETADYQRVLNTSITDGKITVAEIQRALLYRTRTIDLFIKTNNSGKESLNTSEFVKYLLKKYDLLRKGNKLNIKDIKTKVEDLSDRQFLLNYLESTLIGVPFADDEISKYSDGINKSVTKIKEAIPNLSEDDMKRLGFQENTGLSGIGQNLKKDPEGTIKGMLSKGIGMGMIFGVVALLCGKGMKGFFKWGALGAIGANFLPELISSGFSEAKGLISESGDIDSAKKRMTKKQKTEMKNTLTLPAKAPDKFKKDTIASYALLLSSDKFKGKTVKSLKDASDSGTLATFFGSIKYGDKNKTLKDFYEKNENAMKYVVLKLLKRPQGKTFVAELFEYSEGDDGSNTGKKAAVGVAGGVLAGPAAVGAAAVGNTPNLKGGPSTLINSKNNSSISGINAFRKAPKAHYEFKDSSEMTNAINSIRGLSDKLPKMKERILSTFSKGGNYIALWDLLGKYSDTFNKANSKTDTWANYFDGKLLFEESNKPYYENEISNLSEKIQKLSTSLASGDEKSIQKELDSLDKIFAKGPLKNLESLISGGLESDEKEKLNKWINKYKKGEVDPTSATIFLSDFFLEHSAIDYLISSKCKIKGLDLTSPYLTASHFKGKTLTLFGEEFSLPSDIDYKDELEDARDESKGLANQTDYVAGKINMKIMLELEDKVKAKFRSNKKVMPIIEQYYAKKGSWNNFKEHWGSHLVGTGLSVGALLLGSVIGRSVGGLSGNSLVTLGGEVAGFHIATTLTSNYFYTGEFNLSSINPLNAEGRKGWIHSIAFMAIFGTVKGLFENSKFIKGVGAKLSLHKYVLTSAQVLTQTGLVLGINSIAFDGDFTLEEIVNTLLFISALHGAGKLTNKGDTTNDFAITKDSDGKLKINGIDTTLRKLAKSDLKSLGHKLTLGLLEAPQSNTPSTKTSINDHLTKIGDYFDNMGKNSTWAENDSVGIKTKKLLLKKPLALLAKPIRSLVQGKRVFFDNGEKKTFGTRASEISKILLLGGDAKLSFQYNVYTKIPIILGAIGYDVSNTDNNLLESAWKTIFKINTFGAVDYALIEYYYYNIDKLKVEKILKDAKDSNVQIPKPNLKNNNI